MPLTSALFAVAHAAAASLVTTHVLFHKRNVRAAIGWIGIAWLSPLLGPFLYYAFGINRVTRRAVRLSLPDLPRQETRAFGRSEGSDPGSEERRLLGDRYPDQIATIAAVAARVTGQRLMSGNSIEMLGAGDMAYPAMLEAIRGARTSIAVASYIFRADRVGNVFIEALAEARRRGVEVRVLVDGIGSGYLWSPALRRLKAADIPSARFMHYVLPWRMPFLNMRSHKKVMVVDGTLGFTGGLNLGEENTRLLHRPRQVDDVHFRVRGPVVCQIMLTFAEDWSFTTGEVLDQSYWWPAIEPAGDIPARGISSGPDEDLGKLEAVMGVAVCEARQRLRIVSPYFLPDSDLSSAIYLAALRGIQVELFIPEKSDHRPLDWAIRAHLEGLLQRGVACYLTPAPFDHSKLVTVDGQWCLLGSANWDVRSLRLNFEFNLECYGPDTTAVVDELIDRKLARARRLSLKDLASRSLAVRVRDSAARLMLPYL
ncbi:MAG: phospholipase [Alphaproteobacteria bacterium]|nr:phospholipase [Alphaproteobacteria bacterium]